MNEIVYIPNIFKTIVERVSWVLTPKLQLVDSNITGVHFLSGHYTEIKNRLQSKSNSITQKNDKYPLIVLFQDISEVTKANDGFYANLNLQFIILHNTVATDYVEDRQAKVFEPILNPIYSEFFKQIVASGNFINYGVDSFEKETIPRPHWGNPAQYGNDGYILGDVLDGIEIKNFRLRMYKPKGDCALQKNIN